MVMLSEGKETESGIVPSGWRLDCIENLSTISSGTTPSRSAEERYYGNGTTYWVKTMDLTNSDISTTDELVTKVALDETSLRVYPVGTVLVAMYGGFNQIGRTGLLKIPAAVNQAITAIQVNPRLLISGYLINVLNYRVNYWKTIASSSRKDPNITSYDIKKFPITFPIDIKEQQAIVTALSDIDALITSLDKLIAKKRDIKQATMQQLLTGKTRLPGFSGEAELIYKETEIGLIPKDWDVRSVEEIADVTTGDRDTQDRTESGSYPFFVRSQTIERINSYSYDGEAVLTAGDGVGVGKVFHYANGKFDFHQRVYMICNFRNFDGFFFYLYFSNYFSKEATKYNAKNSVDSVRREMVTGMKIPYPSLLEQQAIATVLTDMDAEIAALEQKREKTRMMKQGMMQELLTGKIRLV